MEDNFPTYTLDVHLQNDAIDTQRSRMSGTHARSRHERGGGKLSSRPSQEFASVHVPSRVKPVRQFLFLLEVQQQQERLNGKAIALLC